MKDSLKQMNKATVYINIRSFLSRCEKALDIISIAGYALLFLVTHFFSIHCFLYIIHKFKLHNIVVFNLIIFQR